MSLDPNDLYDVVAINAASTSTQLAGLPFSGPIGAVRVALIDGTWVAFPTVEQLERAVFDMVVAGRVLETTDDVAIMMVEAEATENVIELIAGGAQAPTEAVVAEASRPPSRSSRRCARRSRAGRPCRQADRRVPRSSPTTATTCTTPVASVATDDAVKALTIAGKHERNDRTDEIKAEVLERLAEQFAGREKEIGAAFRSLTKKLVRQRILTDHFRIDGRGITDIRALSRRGRPWCRGRTASALFERGETQILGVTTLDMLKMAQQIDSLGPETTKRYMHHYNFPPYSTGETGRVGSPKRREIGHGALAERALVPVLPTRRGVPVRDPPGVGGARLQRLHLDGLGLRVDAGAAQRRCAAEGPGRGHRDGPGVRRHRDRRRRPSAFVALTDILGAEDAFGDMDFKVAGTKDFVTALQLDTKLDGIPSQVLAGALTQAKDARLTILEVMAEAIDSPDEMSPYAPRITTIKVPVDKIGEVIGPKGKMINSITEETGAQISIEDDGTVFVGATNGEAAQAAIDKINAIANPQLPKIGERFLGTVVKTTDFGAFVSLLPGRDGLVHISKLGRGKRIAKVEDVVKVGDKLRVEIADIDNRGKISLILVAEEDAADSSADRTCPHRRCRNRQQLGPGTASRRPHRRNVGGGTPHQLARWPACRHRVHPIGAFCIGRCVGRCRLARRGTPAWPVPRTSWNTCCSSRHRRVPRCEIAQAVDAVGGELNAFTAREHTATTRVLDTDLELAVDLVADVVLRGRCAADDVEVERDVVLEEIAMRDDDPEDTLGDVFLSAMFGEHPVGRPVIGSVDSVSAMTRGQLHSFHVRRYIPERMVVRGGGQRRARRGGRAGA